MRAIFPSNIAGGVICDAYLAAELFKSMDMAENQSIATVVDAFDPDDRFSPFSPELAQTDADYRKNLEAMPTEDFIQVMRHTIYALFDGHYLTLGMTEKALKRAFVPAMVVPGNDDVHPCLAEAVRCLVPWGTLHFLIWHSRRRRCLPCPSSRFPGCRTYPGPKRIPGNQLR